jgi:hypothetical protein
MTEYDYSPAAYEKYINTQARVSNWVSSQSDHTQSYGNPFVTSTYIPTKPLPEQSSRKAAKSPPRSRSSTTSAPSSTTTTTPTKPTRQPNVRSHTTRDVRPEQRHTPTRSMTMPAYQQAMAHPMVPSQTLILPTSSRDRHDRQDKHRSSSHRSSNKSPSKSSHHSSRHDRSHHHRSSSTSRAYTIDRDATGRRVIQLEPDSRNKVVHLPPPQLGEQYVIVAPPGGTVELVVCYPTHRFLTMYRRGLPTIFQNPQNHKVEYRQQPPREKPRNQDKQEPTLLKRIFGGFGLAGGNRSSSRSKSRSSSQRRRSSY